MTHLPRVEAPAQRSPLTANLSHPPSSVGARLSIDTTRGIAGLKGALRYVRAYRDHIFVVKLGGDVLADQAVLDHVSAQLALLSSLGIRIVVVHGGGPQATAPSRTLGSEPRVVAGRRATDAARPAAPRGV